MNTEIKAFLVFYIDVGNLPPEKADEFIFKTKEEFNKDGEIDKLRTQGFMTIWMPVRPNSQTRVQVLSLSHEVLPSIIAQKVNGNAYAIEEQCP